jgi:methylglyoxal synthase
MDSIPRIEPRGDDDFVTALIAHDGKKSDMLELAREHRGLLGRLRLLATGTTGRMLSEELDLPIDRSASGPEGGDLQIAAKIAGGEVDAVVFLRDPLTAHPHEPDIQALLKVCDVYGVPVATNMAAARILLSYLAILLTTWGPEQEPKAS